MTRLYKILRFGFPLNILNKDLRLVLSSNLIGSFGDGLYSYLLPYYMAKTLNASSVEIGALYAVATLVTALTLLFAGTLADKYDRKKIMIAGWMAWVPAPLIFALAKDWLQMLPGMVFWGVWLGGPTGTAYIVTAADKSKLTLTFMSLSAAWSIGYIFSPAIGGFLAGITGMQVVFYSSFIFYALAGLILLFISSQQAAGHTREASKDQQSFVNLLKTRELLKLSIFFALIMFLLMMFRPFIPKFLADTYSYGDFEIGILGSLSFFGSAVLGILLGRLGDKWKKSYALSVSIVLCSLSLVLLLLFGNFYILIITFFLTGGSYMTWSLMNAIIGPRAPESIRARWISIPQTVAMFSSFIAPYVGGVLYEISPYYPFIITIVAALLLAFLSFTELFEK